jgi:exopolysaccharide biosynthesis polyprenyl glycosylphosphotransferase
MEVTGPRLHVSPVYGLTLLHVSQPTFTGGKWIFKAVLDRLSALLALLVLAPLLLAVAVAIKLEDGGPVLFRQQRVGKAGERFWMLKFRSMVVDAERWRAELDAANEGAGPLFKMRRDPRVTRVGTFIRRYSLDELPQLINVLAGDMSLVGPRPPLPAEVERYGFDARRRLLVKPGLTGLWQVSGRSDLSWEETVQLDLRYVENWSLTMDAAIVWKTAGAVLGGRGAY